MICGRVFFFLGCEKKRKIFGWESIQETWLAKSYIKDINFGIRWICSVNFMQFSAKIPLTYKILIFEEGSQEKNNLKPDPKENSYSGSKSSPYSLSKCCFQLMSRFIELTENRPKIYESSWLPQYKLPSFANNSDSKQPAQIPLLITLTTL